MSANSLLFWMSARGQGSWQQFRTAVEELHLTENNGSDQDQTDEEASDQYALPLYQDLRLNLQRLGHAEFFSGAGNSEWRVTPPSLAVTGNARNWLGLLVGARSNKLVRRLQDAAVHLKIETLLFPDCPDQIRIWSEDVRALITFAEHAGLIIQRDAPAAILTSIPPIDDPAVRRQAELPFGDEWRIERFSSSRLGWKTAMHDEAALTPGDLFRFTLRHQHHMMFCSKGSAFYVPGQVGKFLVLRRRRNVLTYDASSLRLSVPASCRPPFLVERALIMCSGIPPSYEPGKASAGILHYVEIPKAIACLAAEVLRQELL